MVVDDDPIALEVTRFRLEGVGFEVITREQALGTSTAIRRENPDLLLLDLHMPALSGDALARLLSRDRTGTPVVFHSSDSIEVLQATVEANKALGAICKTENDALFLAKFERLFELAERARAP